MMPHDENRDAPRSTPSADSDASPRRWLRIGGVLAPPVVIVLAATLPYLGVIDAPWVFDDSKLVRENELLRVEGAEAAERLTAIFDIAATDWNDEDVRENYRPLRFLSYWVDYRLSRWLFGDFPPDDPPVTLFHIQNIVWHALDALLVFAIARALLRGKLAALLAALLFALHPLETEAVTYVSSRRDVLSTFFFLAAFALYVRSDPRAPLSWAALLLTPPLFALGFFAKEMVITLPAIVVALDLARRARPEWRRITCHVALWAVAAWLISVTVSNEGLIAKPVGGEEAGLGATLLMACRYTARYLGLALFPVSQSIDYSFDAIPVSTGLFSPPSTALSVLLVVGLAAATLVAVARRRVVLGLGLSWFLVGLTPVLQLVPIPERFAERFAYLPSIGVFLIVAALIARAWRARPVAVGVASVVLLATLTGATLARNAEWETRVGLWEAATVAQPRCARAWMAYGNALEEHRQFRDAEESYSTALGIWAENPRPSSLQKGHALRARLLRGGCRAELAAEDASWIDPAIRDFRALLESTDTDGAEIASSPEYAIVRFGLAKVLLLDGRFAEAKAQFEMLLALGRPADVVVRAHYWLGKVAVIEKDLGEAVVRFRRSLAALPEDDESLWGVSIELADLLSNLEGDHERAWAVLEGLLEKNPSDDVRVAILLRMASILDRQGELESAIDRLEDALAIDEDAAPVLLTLAGIRANLLAYEEAEQLYLRVIESDPSNREAIEGLRGVRVKRQASSDETRTVEEKNRDVMRGLVSRGRKHHEKGELLAARDVWSELLRTAGRLGDEEGVALGYCGIARAEEALGRPERALESLEQAESLLPERAETLRQLGAFHMRRGTDPGTARDYYLRYLAALPPGEEPEARALFHLGDLVADASPHAAIDYLERSKAAGIRAILGRDVIALDRRIGELAMRVEDWELAYEKLQAYLSAEPGPGPRERAQVTAWLEERVIPALLEASFDDSLIDEGDGAPAADVDVDGSDVGDSAADAEDPERDVREARP